MCEKKALCKLSCLRAVWEQQGLLSVSQKSQFIFMNPPKTPKIHTRASLQSIALFNKTNKCVQRRTCAYSRFQQTLVSVQIVAQQVGRQRKQLLTPHLQKNKTKPQSHTRRIVIIITISHGHGHRNELSTLASSSCEAMKLSWLTFTRSEAVTTVTMRFSSLPTRFPTSSSSRSLASYWTAQSESCQQNQRLLGGLYCGEETDESGGELEGCKDG